MPRRRARTSALPKPTTFPGNPIAPEAPRGPLPEPAVFLVPVVLVAPRTSLSIVFLIHAALEAPLVVLTLFSSSPPFMQVTDTTVVLLKLYAAIVAATCIASVLVFPHQEFHPGKRALAIALCVYHIIASRILLRAPRFITSAWFDALNIRPENVWGRLHGMLGIMMAVWWGLTLPCANALQGRA